MQEIREGKEGYGDPSGEATEEARPRISSRQTAWSARSAAQGALRWHHTARGLCSSWRRITEKRAGSPRARTCPETEAADEHGYRALLWPATINLVACPYMGGCFQTMLRQAGLSPATKSSLPQAVRSTRQGFYRRCNARCNLQGERRLLASAPIVDVQRRTARPQFS